MLTKLKKMLGIDGLQIHLIASESQNEASGYIEGEIVLNAKYDLQISHIELRCIEKYSRGRMKGKKSDEYIINKVNTAFDLEIRPSRISTIPFRMPLELLKSQMDYFGSKNVIFKSLVRGAKFLRGVKSTYRIEAEAIIKGSALKPLASKEIKLYR